MGARSPTTGLPLPQPYVYEPAPFSLHPTPFPRDVFEKCYEMTPVFNGVVHTMCKGWGVDKVGEGGGGWLKESVRTAAEGDAEFTGRLVSLATEVMERGRTQRVVLGILRSDYMLHNPATSSTTTKEEDNEEEDLHESIPLQVELNTIASSFGCLSSKITRLHQTLYPGLHNEEGDLPMNKAGENIAKGLALAVQEFVRQKESGEEGGNVEPVVVMVVQPGETNSCDQRDLEFLLQSKHNVRLIRRTLHDLATTSLPTNDRHELLLPDGDDGSSTVTAAVVYYRAGYTPDDYPSDVEWEGRARVEHSLAIKCPDVFYHIAGAKKIQQALAQPNTLDQFTTTPEESQTLASTFAGLYALGEGDDSEIVARALSNPGGYVLKPQREGGGNNLYDDELVSALQTMTYAERGGYILMQKIQPPGTKGKLVRGGRVVYDGNTVCELGVFGITLRDYEDENRVLMDGVFGHILRSKSVDTDEGGVAAGYAFLSSPLLV